MAALSLEKIKQMENEMFEQSKVYIGYYNLD